MKFTKRIFAWCSFLIPLSGISVLATSCADNNNQFSNLKAYDAKVNFDSNSRNDLATVALNSINSISTPFTFNTVEEFYAKAQSLTSIGKDVNFFYWEIIYYLASSEQYQKNSFEITCTGAPNDNGLVKKHSTSSEAKDDVYEYTDSFTMSIKKDNGDAVDIKKVKHDFSSGHLSFKLLNASDQEQYRFVVRTFSQWTINVPKK